MAIKNYQYQSIMRDYDDRQARSRHIIEQRRREISRAVPELAQIDQKLIQQSITRAKNALFGNLASLAALEEDNKALSDRKRELLVAYGYPEDYLDPVYVCKDCKDTGYIEDQKCHCFRQAIVDLLYCQSGMQGHLSESTFDRFSLHHYDDTLRDASTGKTARANMAEILSVAQSFVANFDTCYENLLFYGKPGLGKTLLSYCIAGELLASSHTVLYLTAYELFDALGKSVFGTKDASQTEFITCEQILACDLLIIDDLGTEVSNTFTNSQLNLCINERHLRRRSTIISTNLSLQELAVAYSERIFSRIASDYIVRKFIGDDIRLQGKGITLSAAKTIKSFP